jgi:hypothetical protein
MRRRSLYLAAMSVALVLVLAPAALAQSEGLDCGHFANREAAQAILEAHGDLYEHDLDEDGVACEHAGGGTAEDGTLAPFEQYAQQQQYQYSGAPQTLAETGGPSFWIPAAAGTLVLVGACVLGLIAVIERRNWRVRDLGESGGNR